MSSVLLDRSSDANRKHPHMRASSARADLVLDTAKFMTPALERQEIVRKTFQVRGSALDFGAKHTISMPRESKNLKANSYRLTLSLTNATGELSEGWGMRLLDRVQITVGGETLAQYRYLPAWMALVENSKVELRDAARSQCGESHDFAVDGTTAHAVVPLFFFDKFIQHRFNVHGDGRVTSLPLKLSSDIKFEITFNPLAKIGDVALVGTTVSGMELEYNQIGGLGNIDFAANWSGYLPYVFTEEYDDTDRYDINGAGLKSIRVTDIDGPVEYANVATISQASLADNFVGPVVQTEVDAFQMFINSKAVFDAFENHQRIHAWQATFGDYVGRAGAPTPLRLPIGRGTYIDDLIVVNEHAILIGAGDDIQMNMTLRGGVPSTIVIATIKQAHYSVTASGNLNRTFEL